ncbi:MAG: hypothetical protein FWH27_11245, partial [Planctomycetaceae bacterium]|nr:hypothetical protein [Planctomycetaceae bacterium]
GSPIATVPDLVWLLGQRDGIEYFYVQRTGMNDLRTIAATLSQYPKSVVLTSRNYCVEALRIVLPQPCIALETITTLLDDGTIAIDHDAIAEHIKVAFPEWSTPPHEFRKRGQKWVVRFAGSDDVYLNNTDGPYYVAMLLANPGKSMHALDMHQIVSKRDPAKTPKELVVAMSDRQTLSDVEKQLRKLLEELDQARRDGDQIVEQETLDEIEKLKQYLAETKGLGGQSRNFSDAADSIVRTVRQLIKRTINEIDENLEDCAKHLRNSIKTHSVLYYDPETKIDWKL